LCALTRRACQIAEDELGEPPVPYAMMVLGSGGRGESLLAMDQDNAIIYLEGDPGSEVDNWFETLGIRVADLLHMSGVPYCKGGIMASNSEWRMSVMHWEKQIGKWISRTSPEDILKTDIFFDAVAVHGDFGLMDKITNHALELGSGSREFLHLLSSNAADVNSPLGMFGRFRLDQGRIDVKLGGIMPIFSSARVEAIRYRITERSTPGRLRAVQLESDRPEQLFNNLIEAHRIILTAILKQQLYDLENGISLSNKVAPEAMNATAKSNLKWALEQVSSVTDLLGVPA
jgi:DNA polymerase-3 subunit epsilon/CBS domain-containing protein